MAERDLADRLEGLVEAIVRGPEPAALPADAGLRELWRVAADLLALPRPQFRARLKSEIERRASMSTTSVAAPPSAASWLPEGFHSITPYLLARGAPGLIEFMQQAFGAVEKLRVERPDGTIQHAAVAIGDSIVELAEGLPDWPARPAALHVYVEDADATYARALAAGASVLYALGDRPYGDREGDVRDPFGNNWYIATRLQGGPVPAGFHSVTPTLHVVGADRLIDFVERAFGARELERTSAPDGSVVHAELRLGDSILEVGEARGMVAPMPCGIHHYVPDVDAACARALAAGAVVTGEPSDRPYGDRAAELVDPFGNQWFLATRIR